MTTGSLITDLIALGVCLMNQENFSDEQTEITNQITNLRADAEIGVLLVLALPVIGMLVWSVIRLRCAYLTARHSNMTARGPRPSEATAKPLPGQRRGKNRVFQRSSGR